MLKLDGIAFLTSNLHEAICFLPISFPYGLYNYYEFPSFSFDKTASTFALVTNAADPTSALSIATVFLRSNR